MIDNKELNKLLHKENISDVEMISVIEKYIYDRKNVEVDINRPTGVMCPSVVGKIPHSELMINPYATTDIYLMFQMYLCAIKYYTTEKIN